MNSLNNIHTRNCLNHIRKDLEKHLENVISYDFNNIKSGVTNILEYYSNIDAIEDYKIICDATNNPPSSMPWLSSKYIFVDVHIKISSNIITNNIAISPDQNKIRIAKTRKERKEKLNKIMQNANN